MGRGRSSDRDHVRCGAGRPDDARRLPVAHRRRATSCRSRVLRPREPQGRRARHRAGVRGPRRWRRPGDAGQHQHQRPVGLRQRRRQAVRRPPARQPHRIGDRLAGSRRERRRHGRGPRGLGHAGEGAGRGQRRQRAVLAGRPDVGRGEGRGRDQHVPVVRRGVCRLAGPDGRPGRGVGRRRGDGGGGGQRRRGIHLLAGRSQAGHRGGRHSDEERQPHRAGHLLQRPSAGRPGRAGWGHRCGSRQERRGRRHPGPDHRAQRSAHLPVRAVRRHQPGHGHGQCGRGLFAGRGRPPAQGTPRDAAQREPADRRAGLPLRYRFRLPGHRRGAVVHPVE